MHGLVYLAGYQTHLDDKTQPVLCADTVKVGLPLGDGRRIQVIRLVFCFGRFILNCTISICVVYRDLSVRPQQPDLLPSSMRRRSCKSPASSAKAFP